MKQATINSKKLFERPGRILILNILSMPSTIHIDETKTLSKERYTLQSIRFRYKDKNGKEQQKTNEIYSIGDAVVALLYHPQKQTVILTRQLRLVAFLSGVPDGKLIEACAGKLENEDPETGI